MNMNIGLLNTLKQLSANRVRDNNLNLVLISKLHISDPS